MILNSLSCVFQLTCRILDDHRLCESWCSLSGSIACNHSDQVFGSFTDSIDSKSPGLPGTLSRPGPVLSAGHGLKNTIKERNISPGMVLSFRYMSLNDILKQSNDQACCE